MMTESSVEIGAAAPIVWDVFTDVEQWPSWTSSVTELVALDGPGIEIGKRFQIKQPRMPKLVWEVTDVDPGASWTWRVKSLGSTTLATHELVEQGDGKTLVRQRIDQRGPIGSTVGALMRGMTKRYLELEGQGLKTRSEERRRQNASPA
jgi:uncharacterized protein YndB with AHSA1/START domain